MKTDKITWVMLPHDPLLEDAPLHHFFSFLLRKTKERSCWLQPLYPSAVTQLTAADLHVLTWDATNQAAMRLSS